MCDTKIPECAQLMFQTEFCATLPCFPARCHSFLDALKHAILFFFPDHFKADGLVRCDSSICMSVILAPYSCACHWWRSYCSCFFWDCFWIGRVASWVQADFIFAHISVNYFYWYFGLRKYWAGMPQQAAKALPECKQNVSGTVVALEVV